MKFGADVNAQDYDGWTPLIEASFWECVKVVEFLLKAGADVNIEDNNGWTALIKASYEGHAEVVKLLLAAGADIEAKNEYGRTALNLACASDHLEVMKILIEAGAEKMTGAFEEEINPMQDLLKVAIEMGDTEVIELLKHHGAKK